MRFTKPLISLALSAVVSTSAFALDQVASFGSNPGNLDMFEYVPTSEPTSAPLMVVLHGCTQTPDTFNNLTGWKTLAERYGFYMMLPKTTTANQAKGCFNWYEPGDFERGTGEALSIENMINTMVANHHIDQSKIYITGLSAGGIMALDLMASYPDVFAGGAAWSVAPANLARDLNTATSLFYSAQFYDKTPEQWGDLARQLNPGYTGAYPKVSLIMGSADQRFDPRQLRETMEQWTNLHGVDQDPELDVDFRQTTHQVYENDAGEAVVEVYQVQGMIHGSSVDMCDEPCDEDQGGDDTYDYTFDHDLWSAYYSAKFLGLIDNEPQPLNLNITSPADSAIVKDTITVTANASSDLEAVTSVEFYVNSNESAECVDTEVPYECAVNTINYVDGDLTITATGYTASQEVSDSVTVEVQNTAPACQDWDATVSAHATAGRAYSETTTEGQTCYGSFCWGGTQVITWYAEGSDENLGTNSNTTIILKEETAGTFAQGSCPDVDTTAPVITLTGDAEITIYKGQTYADQGATASDNNDGNITANIAVTGSVDSNAIGTYTLTYNVTDAAGNMAVEVTRTVNVVADAVAPIITLTGGTSIGVDVGGIYSEPGYVANDNVDGDITANVTVTGTVDTNTAGTYELTYRVNDASGNSATAVRTVVVAADTVAPIISLLGRNPESIWQGDEFADPGATATDDVDGDITANIVITGNVDINVPGSYVLTYSVTDAAGNSASKTRNVQVIADTAKPSLTLEGSANVTIFVGESFIDPGATSIDNKDGNITANIVVTGSIDTNTVGTYELTYNVSDSAGNAATPVVRTINVIAQPTCQDFTDTVSNHGAAGRAYSETKTEGETCYGSFCFGGTEVTTWYAQGSDENLGTNGNTTITLKSIDSGFVKGGCPADPQPPVIESFEITSLDYNKAIVTGVVSDADGDVDRVVLGLAAVTGIVCEGTTSFTCTLDYSEHDIAVGSALGVTLTAYDSREVASNVEQFTITRPEQQVSEPPVLESYDYTIDGMVMTVNITATDINDDIKIVRILQTNDYAGDICEHTGGDQYTCVFTATTPGETPFIIEVIDLDSNLASSEIFTVIFEEGSSCFSALNTEHEANGRAELRYGVLYYTNGSGDYLGQKGDTTSVEETSAGVWSKVSSCN